MITWQAALAEHEAAVEEFVAQLGRVPPATWTVAPAPGGWSPAEVALHVALSYEFGRDAASGTAAMKLRVPPLAAWVSRTFLLPLALRRGRFPTGAVAPREVRPDPAEAAGLTPEQGTQRIREGAERAASLLAAAAAARPVPAIVHAYFGALSPLQALRLLSAHTRHHSRGLQR